MSRQGEWGFLFPDERRALRKRKQKREERKKNLMEGKPWLTQSVQCNVLVKKLLEDGKLSLEDDVKLEDVCIRMSSDTDFGGKCWEMVAWIGGCYRCPFKEYNNVGSYWRLSDCVRKDGFTYHELDCDSLEIVPVVVKQRNGNLVYSDGGMPVSRKDPK